MTRPLLPALLPALLLALGLLAACQPVRPPSPEPAPSALLQAALQWAAAEQNLAPNLLRVVSVEPVQWPDAALGCPQPDMLYAAVITPGYRIVLAGPDATYTLHTDSHPEGTKIFCVQE